MIAAIVCGLITFEYLRGNGPKVATGFLVIDAVLIAAPIGLVATRPLFAWRIAFLVAGFAGPTVPIRQDTPWPWTPTQMLMFPLLLAVVAVRHRRGVLVWTGLSAALLLVMFVNPGNLAGLLSRRRGPRHRRPGPPPPRGPGRPRRGGGAHRARPGAPRLAEERNRIAREMHDVVAHHMSLIAVQAETAPYRHRRRCPSRRASSPRSPARPARR